MLLAMLVCGLLHIVGSERDTSLVLDDGNGRVALVGPTAEKLVGATWNRLCVEGERRNQRTIGAKFTMTVDRARPMGDGRHRPIVGILRRTSGGFEIDTEGGRRFALRFPGAADERPFLQKRLWILGRWERGKIDVARMGPF